MNAPVRAGDRIGDRYIVECVIGQGGVGIVAAAQHLGLLQRVALKFLRTDHAREPETVQRLFREAQALAQLRGVHVARVMDCGALPTGEPYFAMEFLEGDDLAAVLKRSGPLPIETAASYVLQACEGIAEAHALGIIHRDLKPANLFVTRAPDGTPLVKVLDFGLSKLAESPTTELTDSRHVIGSPHYMSPEQLRSSRNVDERSDIWALGGGLYACLTGKPPFDGLPLAELCTAILCGQFPSVRDARPEVPEALDAVLRRCVAMDAGERFASVAELAHALAPFAGRDGAGRAERVERTLAPTVAAAVRTASTREALPEPPGTSHGARDAAAPGSSDQGQAVERAVVVRASRPTRRWHAAAATTAGASIAVAILYVALHAPRQTPDRSNASVASPSPAHTAFRAPEAGVALPDAPAASARSPQVPSADAGASPLVDARSALPSAVREDAGARAASISQTAPPLNRGPAKPVASAPPHPVRSEDDEIKRLPH